MRRGGFLSLKGKEDMCYQNRRITADWKRIQMYCLLFGLARINELKSP